MIIFITFFDVHTLTFVKLHQVQSFISDPAMNRPAYWLDHQAFCRRHGFDFHEDLIPQFKEAFEHFGQDYDQIRGSVSLYLDGILRRIS